jgi:hypothetical protein
VDAIEVSRKLRENDNGELILFVGPDYQRMQVRARMAGFPTRQASRTEDVQALKEEIAASGKSLILLASAPEVEGSLDRSAFADLAHLAYGSDRVVYFGVESSVVIHPLPASTRLTARHGALHVHQAVDTVAPGETVVGLSVNHL